jgi:hypothetical protein
MRPLYFRQRSPCGAQSTSRIKGFRFGACPAAGARVTAWSVTPSMVLAPGPQRQLRLPMGVRKPMQGWTPTSIPSLEERLDDHQPTRAWENG